MLPEQLYIIRITEKKSGRQLPQIRISVFTDEGDYEISVSAEDKAGNKKIAENVTFRMDKTAPVLSITGVADSQTTDCTATLSVNEAFPFSYDGSSLGSTDVTATITKKTDGAGTTNMAAPGYRQLSQVVIHIQLHIPLQKMVNIRSHLMQRIWLAIQRLP